MPNTFDRRGSLVVWEEWARVTRFLESSRFTLLMAAMRWDELTTLDVVEPKIEVELQGTIYRASVEEHVAALRDMWCLYSSALLMYFALAEAAAAERLDRDDVVGCNGIEDWATQLLSAAGVGWRSERERIGIVEVGVVRNLIAHGERSYSKRAVAKLESAGMSPLPSEGERVVLNYEMLKTYRSRLKSLLNRAGLSRSRSNKGIERTASALD